MKDKSAIIPIKTVDGKQEVLLIRNYTDTRWVIPKGTIEFPLPAYVSATKEAYEEAGVLGRAHPFQIGSYFRNKQLVPTYILEVDVELKSYEEQKRKRIWVKPENIDDYIVDEDLNTIVKRSLKILSKRGSYFKYALLSFCQEKNIPLEFIDKRKAVVQYPIDENDIVDIVISRSGSNIEFVVHSKIIFNAINKIPEGLAANFLMANSKSKLGFWCINKIEDKFCFSIEYNIGLRLLSCEYFVEILMNLALKCQTIEENQQLDKKSKTSSLSE